MSTQEYHNEENLNEVTGLQEQPWSTVVGRGWHRGRNQSSNKTIVGKKNDEEMQAAGKTAWLYISSLRTTSTTETIVNYP